MDRTAVSKTAKVGSNTTRGANRLNTMSKTLDPLQKRRIYDDYLADAPGNKQFEGWCVLTSEKYGTSWMKVRDVVVAFRELEDLTMRSATVSESIKLATMAGATRAEAFRTLARGMKAQTKKVIINKDGNVVDTLITPDFAVQVRAAEATLKALGANEPEKIAVEIADDPTKLSHDQLAEEIARLAKQVTGATEGAKGQESAGEPAILPAQLHEDEGRAGSSESV